MNTLLTNVTNKKLHAMGLTIWQPRARCLVITFEPQNPAAEKILTGMLSVLNLPSKDLMLVKIDRTQPDWQLITDKLSQWPSNNILQLSMDIAPVKIKNINIINTFSPEHLLNNPQDKAQAYKDLLTLRKILHHGTS